MSEAEAAAAHNSDDELAPTTTSGYKPGEKKTLEELQKLDENDESLKKWKESLGLKTDAKGRMCYTMLYYTILYHTIPYLSYVVDKKNI